MCKRASQRIGAVRVEKSQQSYLAFREARKPDRVARAIEQSGVCNTLDFLQFVAAGRRRHELHARCRLLAGVHGGARHAGDAAQRQHAERNAGKRDGNDSFLNRLTLRIQYHLVDHILTHTDKMKAELVEEFGVRPDAVTIMRHPVNDVFPDTGLTTAEAKQKLGLRPENKVILFFGAIRSYKGLEYLVDAFHLLVASGRRYAPAPPGV